MYKYKKFKKKKKNNRVINIYLLITLFVVLCFSITTAYSFFSRNLYITGNVTTHYVEPHLEVKPTQQSNGRYSSNTSLQGGWFSATAYNVKKDVYEENMLTTQLTKGTNMWLTNSIKATFTVTLSNNSEYALTDGKVVVTENDSGNYMTPSNPQLSSLTISKGGTATLSAAITIVANNTPPEGTFVDYDIIFLENGIPKHFHYKVEIVAK